MPLLLPPLPPFNPDRLDEQALRAMRWDGEIPLAQVLTYALPAHGNGWPRALRNLADSPGDWATVKVLAAELAAVAAAGHRPLFHSPIRVAFTDPTEWDEDDERVFGPRPTHPQVRNGMHRIAAAVLAGAPTVLAGNPDLDDETMELALVRAHLSAPGEPEGPLGFAMNWLRSFRLTEHVWVEADGGSTRGGVWETIYWCPHEHAAALADELTRRASTHGAHLTDMTVTATTWRDLEAQAR